MAMVKTDKASIKLSRLYEELENLTYLEQEASIEANVFRGQLKPLEATELENKIKELQREKRKLMKKIQKLQGGN